MASGGHCDDTFQILPGPVPLFLCSTLAVYSLHGTKHQGLLHHQIAAGVGGDGYLKGLQTALDETILWSQAFFHKETDLHNHPGCQVTCMLSFLALCNYMDFLPIFHASPCLYSLLPSVSTALDLLLLFSSFKDKPSLHSARFLA